MRVIEAKIVHVLYRESKNYRRPKDGLQLKEIVAEIKSFFNEPVDPKELSQKILKSMKKRKWLKLKQQSKRWVIHPSTMLSLVTDPKVARLMHVIAEVRDKRSSHIDVDKLLPAYKEKYPDIEGIDAIFIKKSLRELVEKRIIIHKQRKNLYIFDKTSYNAGEEDGEKPWFDILIEQE